VTVDSLIQKGLVKPKRSEQANVKKRTLVKILGLGDLTKKLLISADAFSASAVEAIEKVGGKAHKIKEL